MKTLHNPDGPRYMYICTIVNTGVIFILFSEHITMKSINNHANIIHIYTKHLATL